MQAIEKAAQIVTNPNPHHNPMQLTSSDQDDDALPYRWVEREGVDILSRLSHLSHLMMMLSLIDLFANKNLLK